MNTATVIQEKETVSQISTIRTATTNYRYGVHVHLFGINKDNEIVSALILKRASNNQFGIISGKAKHEEALITTAYREINEETGLFPIMLFDTGRKQTIHCNKYDFHISVFTGIIPHNAPIKLNNENTEYAYIPTALSPCHIEILEQRKNQIFCINKTREMYHRMMN